MIQIHVNLSNADADPTDASPALPGLLERAARAALAHESVSHGEISLTLLDDEGIRDLNLRYLERDRPTDVLAFALHDEGEPVLGDVYVGVAQARRQAREVGVPLEEELVRLTVHGTLHVLGYDHPEDGGREESEHFRIQEALVRDLMEAP